MPSVWRFVYVRVHGDPHLAEDIVSETVLALIKAVSDDTTDIQNPGAWLRSVASNKVTDHFRAAARVQHLIEEAKKTSPVSDDNDAVKQQEFQERRAEVRDVMDQLPEQQRIALEWKYIEKLSVREMAERMDTTEKAVESILFRARRDFRQRMMRQQDHDEPLPTRPAGRVRTDRSGASPGSDMKEPESGSNDSEAEPGGKERSLETEKVTQS